MRITPAVGASERQKCQINNRLQVRCTKLLQSGLKVGSGLAQAHALEAGQHLGDEAGYQPNRRGFDETFIHGGGGIGQTYAGSCGDAPSINW